MSLKSLCVGSILLLFATTGLAAQWQEIQAPKLKALMDQGDPLVVFPLSGIEFRHMHIEGAVHIPMEDLESKLPEDRDRTLVFYCLGRTCTAAATAASRAIDYGYRKVFAFRDGLPGWVKAGYPTVTIEGLPSVALPSISPAELNAMLDSGQDIVLLDIRADFEAQKMWPDYPSRLQFSLEELPTSLEEIPRDKKLVIIDYNGKRSPVAARYLHGKGFTSLLKMDGGMMQWVRQGLPTVFPTAEKG